ncbi:MAG: hypothetical protein CL811_12345 [Colwelliaceae bacterium]|nr:hypothetical protein [Colwelliaceae bacterium]
MIGLDLADLFYLVTLGLAILSLGGFLGYLFYSDLSEMKDYFEACEELGFEFYSTEYTEEGYVQCCERVYENHIQIEDYCEVYSEDYLKEVIGE